ncbi:hypothetical protein, partial [Bartonella sp. CL29QHWL]|uniref:hypothetical protein n=1 Tax=Bartonella sp. CL29QHWL TaxID=3243522 RepID=UPI0035CEA81A
PLRIAAHKLFGSITCRLNVDGGSAFSVDVLISMTFLPKKCTMVDYKGCTQRTTIFGNKHTQLHAFK